MTTRDEIPAMAREAGFAAWPWLVAETADKLERLVRLAQAAAYERAAKYIEKRAAKQWIDVDKMASEIRALKEQA